MQTPDASEPHADRPDDAGQPALDTLLRRSAEGDRAAFSAFYDATVPWVHGLAEAMFGPGDDAAAATVRTYLTAWEEASEAGLDLSERDDATHRERQVFTWLEVLAHRVMTSLRRAGGSAAERGRRPGPAGPAPLPEDLVGRVAPDAYEAVRLAWLGGCTDREVADRLGLPAGQARTLLRDGVRQVVAARRDLTQDAARPSAPAPATGPTLGADVREDVDAGRTLELADLAAEPPSALLDEVLRRLPAQDVGMDLIGDESAPAGPPRDRLRWLKVTALVLLAALVLGVGGWTVWSQFTRPGIVHRIDQSKDLFTTSEYPAQDGGTVQAFLSREQNSGYLMISGMPQLPEGQSYQLWLYPSDGTAPASLGTFDANGFGEPVTFRGLDRFAAMGISVEPSSGSEVPTSEPIVGVDLDPTAQTGPRYGGRPSNN